MPIAEKSMIYSVLFGHGIVSDPNSTSSRYSTVINLNDRDER